MKKIVFTCFLACAALLISISYNAKEAQALTHKPGDILVTNKTSFVGIAGHSAIVIDSKHVLHTSGWKSEPYPKVMTIKSWYKRYGNKVKVVRPNNANLGKKAANNAKKYFKSKKIPYSLKTTLKSTKKTYCSQLVWYSYYKAGKTFKTKSVTFKNNFDHVTWSTPTMIKPYDFANSIEAKYNGFKLVDNKF